MTRVLLAFVVFFSESTVFTELADLRWPKHRTWIMGLLLCGVTATGFASIMLRIFARKSDVCDLVIVLHQAGS